MCLIIFEPYFTMFANFAKQKFTYIELIIESIKEAPKMWSLMRAFGPFNTELSDRLFGKGEEFLNIVAHWKRPRLIDEDEDKPSNGNNKNNKHV